MPSPFSLPTPFTGRGSKRCAIVQCRTAALGGYLDQCDSCGDLKVSYNSCRNRNCPKCGNLKKEQWVADRTSELLPVPYFHTVFTVPHELNPLFLANPKRSYLLLFQAASQTLSKLALDPKFLGAQIGVTMVLHSWGQNLSFHPHVHCIVLGGGLSPSGCSFVRSRKKFFIPVKVFSKMFRSKLLESDQLKNRQVLSGVLSALAYRFTAMTFDKDGESRKFQLHLGYTDKIPCMDPTCLA